MKVLLSWLREFVDIPAPPEKLAQDLTLAGLAVDAIDERGSDTLLDLDITTNRVDCMNVYGIAREVSVLYQTPLRPPEVGFVESGTAAASALTVVVEAPELCPRFCGRVLDIRVAPSPAWMRERLEAVGVRSINNIVDLTNYVMIELGQPAHAFDLDLVPQGRLAVRWAKPGESLKTLDGVDRKIAGRVGVVAGAEGGPLALAGIMGGASTEVSGATRLVALEAAWWEPLAIRRAARAMGMHTEASHRFERGADPEGPVVCVARIAHLLQKIGGGSVRPGVIDVAAVPFTPRKTGLRPSRVPAVLGTSVPEDEWRRTLGGLGFTVGAGAEASIPVTIPTWRGDVAREIDLVEEIARHHGLDKVPATLPAAQVVGGLRPWQTRERALCELLVGAGLSEVVHYAFVSEAESRAVPGPRVALENPLSEEQDVLRNSLVVPGLLTALRRNLNQDRRDVALFEMGRVFEPSDQAPREERRLGILLAGAAHPQHWSEKSRAVDFFDGKGLIESALLNLGVTSTEWSREDATPFLHPGQAAVVRSEGLPLGYVGALHPDVAAAFELREGAIVGELRIDALLAKEPEPVRFHGLDRFPAVHRDISVLCDAELAAVEIEAAVVTAGGGLLRAVTVTDRYAGPPVPEGKVSLTIGLVLQRADRTLGGEEVQATIEQVVRALRSRGAEIRGE